MFRVASGGLPVIDDAFTYRVGEGPKRRECSNCLPEQSLVITDFSRHHQELSFESRMVKRSCRLAEDFKVASSVII